MEDALHGALQVEIVAIDGSRVLPPVVRGDLLSGAEEGFDGLVAKDEQGGDRPQTGRKGLIATRRADPADDLFTAELLRRSKQESAVREIRMLRSTRRGWKRGTAEMV